MATESCACPTTLLFSDCGPADGPCPGVTLEACERAASFRKAPQTLGPAVCGDLDACGNVVIGPDDCLVGIEHLPVSETTYQNSSAVCLQGVVDQARRQVHTMGFRPYRVFLVWTKRDRRQIFREFRRQELMPVRISPLTDVDLELKSIGLDLVGGVRLTRISPNQVEESVLRGLINEKPLANDEEFFYEVVRQPRFPGEKPVRGRFTIATTPYLNGSRFQWEVDIISQDNRRDRDGEDQTFEPKTGSGKRRLEILRR